MVNAANYDVNVRLNLFEKNFGQKLNKISNNLNKNLSQIQNTAQNFNLTTESLNQTQKVFGLNMTKTGKSLRTVEGRLLSNTNSLNKYIAENVSMGQVFRMNSEQFKNFNLSGAKINNTSARMANSFRKGTQGLKGFRMEFLSVMFLGMFLQRTFTGLLKTSMEWVGVTEVMSMALGILFLPVAEMILTWALLFLDAVLSLTEGQKKLIGVIVLVGAALGGALFLFGTLALGIGGLIMAFGLLALPILLVVGALAALIAIILGGAIFDSLIGETNELEATMNGLDFDGIKTKISEGITKALNYLTEKLPVWLEKGLELAQTVLDGIAQNWDKISDTMDKMITAITTWIQNNSTVLAKIGWDIVKAITVGMIDAFGNFFAGLGESLGKRLQERLSATSDLGLKGGIDIPGLPGRQLGGQVSPNTPYVVGERGPELFTPNTAGRISPNGSFGGGIVVNYTINASGNNSREMEELIKRNNIKLVSDLRRLVKV